MNLDDRSLEELSGLFLEEDAAECAGELAQIAAERGLPSDPPVAETLLRSGRVSAAQLAELLVEARKRRSDRLIEALKAGRDADLSRARRFGRYALLRELGRGGLGRVWLAWDADLRRLVALKLLAAHGEEHLRRLRREAQVASQLEHPRIARVYELSEAHGVPYLAMEYIEAESLEGVDLAPLEAAAAIRDAARVVQAAHDRGIVHRDLKPGNLLRRGGEIFVVDFGLAKPLAWEDSVSADGRILGTLPYMSPEQAQGRVVGPASDVYSLGATLYRLAVGRAPLRAANAMELLAKLARRDIPPPRHVNPAIPPALEAVIGKAMEDEPARYPSAAALADDLDRFLRGEPVSAQSSGFAAAAVRSLRRNPMMMWTAALLLALFAWMALFGASNSARVAELIESSDRHAAEGRYQEALADLDRAVELAGDRQELKTRRAHAEERLRASSIEQVDLANRRLEGARALLEEARLNLYRKGSVFSERFFASLESALAKARESAAIRETSTARYLIGAILHLRGDHDEALAEYARALELEPGHVAARLAKARAYVDQGVEALFGGAEPDSVWHFESARRVFEGTPDLARGALEGEIESQLAWAWNLVAADRPEEAVRYASQRAGASEEFVVVQGVALARMGQPREALRVLAAAIDRRPNYYQAYFFRGSLTSPLNVDFALREFDQALAIHPRYLPCLLARAELRFRSGRRNQAVEDWTAAIRIRPALETELAPKIASARDE
jgi:tetratricopeptide (TPR) repeat protein